MAEEKNSHQVAKEAHAYTPGLKIKKNDLVRKVRKLPILGDVYFNVGDQTDFESIVAKAMLPGDPHIVKAADLLEVLPADLKHYMVNKIGDKAKKGEPIAKYKAFFGLIKNEVKSPIDGIIESISDVTGQVIIRGKKLPVEIKAYIPGKIVEIIPQVGAVIEINAAFIQGIFGIGGETWGEIMMLAESSNDILKAEAISPDCKGKIIVGGSLITLNALKKAVERGVNGIVVGGIIDTDLIEFLGYEVGVAITGDEELGLTLIITEGFGKIAMSHRAFNLLKTLNGQKAAVNGTTQIRAGVLRPEIIVPNNEAYSKAPSEELSGGIRYGTPIRIIREPYFGEIATIVSLPVELQKLESESSVRVAQVQLENGERVIVPRANLEIIEI